MQRQPISPLIIILAVVAFLTACTPAAHYDGRLAAADSLMHDRPDSALAILQALHPDSLATQGDHAYRDLLLTQARYKCYITATTDSAINRALHYYRRHSHEQKNSATPTAPCTTTRPPKPPPPPTTTSTSHTPK